MFFFSTSVHSKSSSSSFCNIHFFPARKGIETTNWRKKICCCFQCDTYSLLWRFACLIVCFLWRFVVGADFLFCNLHRYVSLQLTLDVRNWILCLFCTFRLYASSFFGVCTVLFLVFLGTNFSFPFFHRLLLLLSNLPHPTLQVS